MKPLERKTLDVFFEDQSTNWPLARDNYHALRKARSKTLKIDGFNVRLQFNPGRIGSSLARVDEESVAGRKCFLCDQNRPSRQGALSFHSDKGNDYKVLLNPYPIFPKHFTIPSDSHTPQMIKDRLEDMLQLVDVMEDYVVFYNGPKCGASAPDHLHFQAGNKGFLPMEVNFSLLPREVFYFNYDATLSFLTDYIKGALVIEGEKPSDCAKYFFKLLEILPCKDDEYEPMVNVLAWKSGKKYTIVIIPREKHRPSCFSATGLDHFVITPASVEFAGVYILPRKIDFLRMRSSVLQKIISEVCVKRDDLSGFANLLKSSFRRYQPNVSVGLMSDTKVNITFQTLYRNNGVLIKGEQSFRYLDGKVYWNGEVFDDLFFDPGDFSLGTFELEGVTIGVNFHWERKERQRFQGGVAIIAEKGRLTVINLVGVEDYLTSVISSEMNPGASKEFLKAHAVISRSWLMAQMEKNKGISESENKYSSYIREEGRLIRWYDREDHDSFDVCADDHCQRYQGISKISNIRVSDVISETWGKVLKYDGVICDARFSKCCGGITEQFGSCWEDTPHPYLVAKRDTRNKDAHMPDLTIEKKAEHWVRSEPDAYCNTKDPRILSLVLNNFDLETTNYYRWTVEYGQEEIAQLIKKKTGVDFGEILDLLPIKRGPSGRIYELKIIGMKRAMVIGKELEIRRSLSETHLYSSAFVVKKSGVYYTSEEVEIPERFKLYGAGWGHGVGLCQIGAAVMGERGCKYDEILLHYFDGATIDQNY